MLTDGSFSEVQVGVATRKGVNAVLGATVSKIGGSPVWHSHQLNHSFEELFTDALTCPRCQDKLELIFTLYAPIDSPQPLERSLYFFACTKATCCVHSACWRVVKDQTTSAPISVLASSEIKPLAFASEAKISTVASTKWDFLAFKDSISMKEKEDDDDLSSLEALLSQRSIPTEPSLSVPDIRIIKSSPSESIWLVEDISEGYVSEALNGPDANGKDEHIRRLLESYLNDEEDSSVKTLLQTAGPKILKGDNLAGKAAEEEGDEDGDDLDDKKIDHSDMKSQVELFFQRRVALHPKQVMRYAYGGQPLWCTHPPPPEANNIPLCESCGSQRVFEAQLMPALLQYYDARGGDNMKVGSCREVDQASTADELASRFDQLRTEIGFEFGVVALWSCPLSCDATHFEVVVVQPPCDYF